MKKVMNIMAGLFFLLVALPSKAAGEIKVEIHEDQTLVVELKAAGMDALLLLQDKEGTILFQDSLITNKPYKTSLHLKLLPEGTYILNVEEDFSIRSWTLDKAEGYLKLRKDTPEIVYKPHFEFTEDRVRVFMSNPWGTKTTLSVYDPRGNVVGLSGDKKSAFRRTLDFSQVPEGLYRVHIKTADKSFLETIRIEPKRDPGRISMLAGKGF